jgi:hypothetical protein
MSFQAPACSPSRAGFRVRAVILLLVLLGCRSSQQDERPTESLADWCGPDSEWPSFAEVAYAVQAAECAQHIRCGAEFESRPENVVESEDYYWCIQSGYNSWVSGLRVSSIQQCVDVCEAEAYVWWYESNCGTGPMVTSNLDDPYVVYQCDEANWPW